MKIDELKKLVAQGESETLEFKKSTGQLSAAAKTLCAFLNTAGGVLLFGVTDAQKVVGQQVTGKTKEQIAAMLSGFSPRPAFEVNYIKILDNDKQVIIIDAQQSMEKVPYTYRGKAYRRNQNTTEDMSREQYNSLVKEQLRVDRCWELEIAHDYNITDLDENEIMQTVADGVRGGRLPESLQGETVTNILKGFGLIKDEKVSKAAVLLFAKKLNPEFFHCKVKMAKFRGSDKSSDFIDERQCVGTAFQIIKESEDFIRRNMKIGMEFKEDSFQRLDRPDYSMLAIREALVNSVCHRDYTTRGVSLTIAMFSNRLEIWNPGKLLPEISLDDLKKPDHVYAHRNEAIAGVFYARKFIEGWGTGTTRMLQECDEINVPGPEFEEKGSGFSVTFNTAVPDVAEYGSTDRNVRKLVLSARQQNILQYLKDNQLKGVSIQEITNFAKASKRTINRDLAFLKEKGLVSSEGETHKLKWFFGGK